MLQITGNKHADTVVMTIAGMLRTAYKSQVTCIRCILLSRTSINLNMHVLVLLRSIVLITTHHLMLTIVMHCIFCLV
jgi:hypothetical protein